MKIEQTPGGSPPSAPVSSLPSHSDETLCDGTKVVVRDLGPEDYPAVLALADSLGGDELYLRFFTDDPKYLAGWFRWPAEPAAADVVLGAFDGRHLLAVGKYVATGEMRAAEISIVVADPHHHHGIATAFLRRLGEHAKRAGTQRLVTDVQTQNTDIRQVIAAAGWPCTRHRNNGAITIEVHLTETCSTGLAEPERTASISARCVVR